jgi:hypothetical protein
MGTSTTASAALLQAPERKKPVNTQIPNFRFADKESVRSHSYQGTRAQLEPIWCSAPTESDRLHRVCVGGIVCEGIHRGARVVVREFIRSWGLKGSKEVEEGI